MEVKHRLNQLDGLRGIFALMVVLMHFNISTSFFTNNFLVRQSYLFVDFFFVLSGFIISFNYVDNVTDFAKFKTFFLKRFIRLYPLLFFSVILYFLYFLVGEFVLSSIKVEHNPLSFYIGELMDSLLFMNSNPILGDSQGMNAPSWSISAEVISYTVFAIGIYLLRGYKYLYSIFIILACVAFMVFKNSYTFRNGDYGFVRGLLGFNFGVLTYWFYQKFKFQLKYAELPALILLVFAFYFIDGDKVELYKLAFPLIFSITIYILLNSNGFLCKLLSSKIPQFLGRISYSIYLNHYLLLTVVFIIFFKIMKFRILEPYSSICLLVSLFVVIIYSYFTYKYIEIGVGKYLNSIWIKNKQVTKIESVVPKQGN